MRDLYSNIGVRLALKPAVASAAANGESVDLHGFNRVSLAVNTGAIAGDGDFGIKLQESDSGSSNWTDVAADQVDTNAPTTLEADSAYKLGYRGFKRFIRPVLTKAGGTSIAIGAVALLGDAASRPVA